MPVMRRVGGPHRLLQLDGQVDLGLGGDLGQALAVQVEVGDGHAVGLGQAQPLVGRGEGGVVARLGQRLGQHVVVEAAGVGEALPVARDHPHADARRGGRGQLLDVALVDPHLGGRRPAHHHLDLLAALGQGDDPVADLQQLLGIIRPPSRRR